MTVVTNSAIEHELQALLDDTRLMYANSHYGHTPEDVQIALSKRKKEIRASLKHEWLVANPEKSSRDFDVWLNTESNNSPMLKDA